MRIVYLVGTGSWIFSVIYHLIDVWNHKKSQGTWWSKEESPYFKRISGTLDWFLVMCVVARAILSVGLVITVNKAIESSVEAGI